MCDMTRPYAWDDPFIRIWELTRSWVRNISLVWDDSFIRMLDMTNPCVTHDSRMWDDSFICAWDMHDSFMRKTWLMLVGKTLAHTSHVCGMPCSYLRHDSLSFVYFTYSCGSSLYLSICNVSVYIWGFYVCLLLRFYLLMHSHSLLRLYVIYSSLYISRYVFVYAFLCITFILNVAFPR